jgi:hypothetical protein
MAANSSSDDDDPIVFKGLEPKEFLKHAENLVKFEWLQSHRASPESESKKKVSSLLRLATDGLIEEKEPATEDQDSESGRVVKLCQKET